VNQLCKFLHCPTTKHLKAAKGVLRYLKGTPEQGLHFKPRSLQLHAYCDSNWAGDPLDCRSTIGNRVFIGSNLVSWHAKKQTVVSRSNIKAEYHAMAITTAEISWLRMLLKELEIVLHSPSQLWCDNLGAIALASNPIYHACTKPIEVDYHFIREKILYKDLTASYISTQGQYADIFTKGLTLAKFLFLRDKLMVTPPPISLKGTIKLSNDPDLPNHIDDDLVVDTTNVPAALCNYARSHPSERSSAPSTDRSNGYLSSRVHSSATTNMLERSYRIDPP
jgi:hypothetical protein